MSDTYGQSEILEQLESELGQVVTIGGLDYPCIAGTTTDSKSLEYGGYATSSGIEIVVRASLFTTPPVSKDVVTFASKELLINSIAIANDGSCYVLTCDDADNDA